MTRPTARLTGRHLAIAVAAAALGLSVSAGAQAKTVVHVTLWDKGPSSLDGIGNGPMRGLAMAGPGHSGASMGITATPGRVKAGEVEFEVQNSSKMIVHEMIVAPEPHPLHPLPYSKADMRVNEDQAGHLGEVSELTPGGHGALRLTLKPGRYVLYCNVAGHYASGMWTEVTVAP